MSRLGMSYRYLRYLMRAKTKYYIHSPFVFAFINEVLHDQRHYYAFEDIAYLRRQLLLSKQSIAVSDYGAGSGIAANAGGTRQVRHIAKYAAASEGLGQLLFKMMLHYQPQHILELGTSLGLGSLYMALANRKAQLFTIEGCSQTAALAQRHFDVLQAHNVHLQIGTFEQQLPRVLQQLPQLDFVFVDGNHRKIPTLQYFESCLPHLNENSIMVFDDIYWSKEMSEAWKSIKKHPRVTVSIDLFRVGIAFFHSTQRKQHFTLLASI